MKVIPLQSPAGDPSYYGSLRYCNIKSFESWAQQLAELLKLQARTVLEIGIGNGILSYLLRTCGCEVTTVDYDASLKPDIVGSVLELPFSEGQFEVAGCYEVLEHLPFEQFGQALSEIRRVVRTAAVISLPDCRPWASLQVRIPPWRARRLLIGLPLLRAKEHQFDGQHHWEVNKRGYPLTLVRKTIAQSGWFLAKTFRIRENPYHRVFVLQKEEPKDLQKR